MKRTNQENHDHADYRSLLAKAGLTEQEAAKAAELHINTVKKIIRGDHVHSNSRLKLYRILRQAVEAPVVPFADAMGPRIKRAGDIPLGAKTQAVLAHADALSSAALDLAHSLTRENATLAKGDFDRFLKHIELARAVLLQVKGK